MTIIEGFLHKENVNVEDSGMAMIGELDDDAVSPDGCFFVRLQSWDENNKAHPFFKTLIGKRLRVTIEVIDDPQS